MGFCFSKTTLTLTEKEEILIFKAEQYVKDYGRDGISAFYKDQMKKWNEFELHFALIRSSESGKSSFITEIFGYVAMVIGQFLKHSDLSIWLNF